MIKQTLLLSLVGIALTGCVVAPYDDRPYYSSQSYGHGDHRPNWNNNNNGHRPPPKPVRPQYPHGKPSQNQPGHHGPQPSNQQRPYR